MAITFDAETGLSAQDTETIRADIVSDWESIFNNENATLNTESESPAGQLIDTIAVLETAKDSEFLELANQFNPEVADGRFQDAIGKIYFLTRTLAESTVVQCQCTGLYGTVIPANAIVQNTDGYNLYSLGSATIPTSGTVNVDFAVQDAGAISIGANTVTKIITTIAGWDTVNNEVAGVIGKDKETRAEFEARRYNSVAANARGSVASLYGALAAIDGVLDVSILENDTAADKVISDVTVEAHSIAICIYGGEDDDIAEAIYNKKDAGCGTCGDTEINYTATEYNNAEYTYNIVRPTATAVKFLVTIRQTSATTEDTQDIIAEAIYNEFYGQNTNARVGLNQTVYASRFYSVVIATGITNLETIQLMLDVDDAEYADSIEIPANIEPTLTLDDVTVETIS